jgi:baseplate J-like protein
MAIAPINLDDRTFSDLVRAAVARIRQVSPDWTDFSPSNPGMVLVDVCAHMTEQTLFKLNGVPGKLKVELLRLLDVSPLPPTPAATTLRFERASDAAGDVLVPRFTRVQAEGGIVFSVLEERCIERGMNAVEVPAYQVERVAEDVGRTLGIPGQTVNVRRGPIASNLVRELDVAAGVERRPGESAHGQDELSREDDVDWAIWREVESFADGPRSPLVVQVDRWLGEVRFPPQFVHDEQAAAGVPEPGRRIRVWYHRTAGAAGNLPLQAALRLLDPLDGVSAVRALSPASGGRDGETVARAASRAPLQVARLRRAVTAADYESYALQVPGVRRARALPAVQYRPSALPGTVDLILVPALDTPLERLSLADLQHPRAEVLRQVTERIESRQVLGSRLRVSWANYKEIGVSARVVVDTTTPIDQMKSRLLRRLHQLIQPLGDWPFGQAVRASNVYEALLAEPGVRYAEDVQLSAGALPASACRSVATLVWSKPGAREPEAMWLAASGAFVFQSSNQAQSWELCGSFEAREMVALAVSKGPRLLIAALGNHADGTRVWVSEDAGETWTVRVELERHVGSAVCWVARGGKPFLVLGTSSGLFEVDYQSADEGPRPVVFDAAQRDRGVNGLAAVERDGVYCLALAPRGAGALFVSAEAGESGSFENVKTERQVHSVAFQKLGQRYFLWAGLAEDANDGYGCLRFDLLEQGFRAARVDKGWSGGTCRGLAFAGTTVLAGTNRAGVLRLDSRDLDKASWRLAGSPSGLPRKDDRGGALEPIGSAACFGTVAVVGTERGVYRSEGDEHEELGERFTSPADQAERDTVSLPAHWLPCSGRHQLDVRSIGTP